MKIGLKFMIINSRIHIIKRNIGEVPGNDIYICNCLRQQEFDALESAVNICYVYNSHRYKFLRFMSSFITLFADTLLYKILSVQPAGPDQSAMKRVYII